MKKIFKNLSLVFIAFICSFSMIGCAGTSPKSVFKDFLYNIETLMNQNDISFINKIAEMYYWEKEEDKNKYIEECQKRYENSNIADVKSFQEIKFSLVNFDLISQTNYTKNDAIFYYNNEKVSEVIEVNIKIEIKETSPAGSVSRHYVADDDLIYSYLSSYGLIDLKCDSVTTLYKIDNVWYMGMMPCKENVA